MEVGSLVRCAASASGGSLVSGSASGRGGSLVSGVSAQAPSALKTHRQVQAVGRVGGRLRRAFGKGREQKVRRCGHEGLLVVVRLEAGYRSPTQRARRQTYTDEQRAYWSPSVSRATRSQAGANTSFGEAPVSPAAAARAFPADYSLSYIYRVHNDLP